jgi:hypothetical protein
MENSNASWIHVVFDLISGSIFNERNFVCDVEVGLVGCVRVCTEITQSKSFAKLSKFFLTCKLKLSPLDEIVDSFIDAFFILERVLPENSGIIRMFVHHN